MCVPLEGESETVNILHNVYFWKKREWQVVQVQIFAKSSKCKNLLNTNSLLALLSGV